MPKAPVPSRSLELSNDEPVQYLSDYLVTVGTVSNLRLVCQTRQS